MQALGVVQLGCRHEGWYSLRCSHSVLSFPWYIGMGWTVGCRREEWYSLGCSHSVTGTFGYMMGCDRRYSEWDRANGHELPVLRVQCIGIPEVLLDMCGVLRCSIKAFIWACRHHPYIESVEKNRVHVLQ